jgi:site-specific recombinase XerD
VHHNWARSLPIHVTQKLAGYADIQTTQKYYLSVQEEDLRAARRAQQQTVKGADPHRFD